METSHCSRKKNEKRPFCVDARKEIQNEPDWPLTTYQFWRERFPKPLPRWKRMEKGHFLA